MNATTQVLHGGCHCGRLALAFTTALDPADVHPRACDCSFCQKHGATWVSDRGGRLEISTRDGSAAHAYRQGSDTARFLLCGQCGVLVAVVFDDAGQVYGAANATCLDDAGFGQSVVASPQQLNPAEKVSRWRGLWIPDVVLPPLTSTPGSQAR